MIGQYHRLTVDTAVEIFLQSLLCAGSRARKRHHPPGLQIQQPDDLQSGREMVVKVVTLVWRLLRPSEDSTQIMELTQTEVFGSPLHMSPEQCAGQSLDESVDIYSACGWHCRFDRSAAAARRERVGYAKSRSGDALPMSDITLGVLPHLNQAYSRVAQDPHAVARYQNVAELLVDLQAVAAGRERVLVTAQMKKPSQELAERSGVHGGYAEESHDLSVITLR